MRRILHILFFLFFINHFVCLQSGFTQQVQVVHQDVGVLIDSTENFKYLLFTDYSFHDFIGAQVFKSMKDESYYQVIYLKNDRLINKPISLDSIKMIHDKIDLVKNKYIQNDTTSLYSVYFKDGSIINGIIKTFTNNTVSLYSENVGQIELQTTNIIQIIKKEEVKTSTVSRENPHYSRYFYAPSAMPADKGEGYFQDIYLLFLSANYSVTSHTTIGAGFSIIPGISLGDQAFFVNAKVAYKQTERFYLGGGGLYFSLGEIGGDIGIGYLVGTYGTKNHNATLGIGYGFSGDKLMETPVFTLCGMTRLSKRISFMTENWFGTVNYNECIQPDCMEYRKVREFHCLISYGLRFFSENISVDIAFMNVPTSEEMYFPGIPYIDFVVRF